LFCSLPALADYSKSTIFYGKINVDIESIQSDIVTTPDTTATSLERVQSNSSRVGLKGSEDFNNGFEAIYQFEVQVDSVNNKNAKTPFNNVRNSSIGLKGAFGTVFAGNWDSPYKTVLKKFDFFDRDGVFTATNLAGVADNNKNFSTRQNNVIQYWSPINYGLSGRVSYALDSAKTATTNMTSKSMSAVYENENVYISYAYLSRADITTLSKSDSAERFVGAFIFSNGQIGIMYERLTIANSLSRVAAQRNLELAGQYKINKHSLEFTYVKNDNFNNVPNSGAKQVTLQYGYNQSKSTELYAAYVSLLNDTGANYSFYPGSAIGSQQTGLGLGMIYSF